MGSNKICIHCKIEKPNTNDYFTKRSKSKDGLESFCKECGRIRTNRSSIKYRENNAAKIKEKYLKHKEENKEEIIENGKKYYKKNFVKILKVHKEYRDNNKEKVIEINAKYRIENKDKIKEQDKKYYQKNKIKISLYRNKWKIQNIEKVKKTDSKWRKENPEKTIATSQRYRARKLSLPYTFTDEQWEVAKIHFNNSCCYCGEKKPLAREHFIPVNDEGGYIKSNIVPSCQRCNSSKGVKKFKTWYHIYKFYDKDREKITLEYLATNNE